MTKFEAKDPSQPYLSVRTAATVPEDTIVSKSRISVSTGLRLMV